MDSERDAFERDGFLLVPSVVPAELLDRVRERIAALAPADPRALVKIDNSHREDGLIRELVSHPSIGARAAALTGASFVQVFATQLLIKPTVGEARSNVGWHQDQEYWDPALEGELLTAWIAVSDVREAAGPMRFVRGSHTWGLLKAGDFFSGDLEAIRGRIESRRGPGSWDEVPAILPPGGVSFHHRLLVHGSGPNRSGAPRVSFAVHLRTEKSGVRPGVRWQDVGYISSFDDPLGSPVAYRA